MTYRVINSKSLKNLHSILKIPNVDFLEKWVDDEAGFALVKDWSQTNMVALALLIDILKLAFYETTLHIE